MPGRVPENYESLDEVDILSLAICVDKLGQDAGLLGKLRSCDYRRDNMETLDSGFFAALAPTLKNSR